ncbi:MAG: hypothetical protein IJ191_03925 [Treponema sp.]|nr:hypothetical protein [Treponema sp.]
MNRLHRIVAGATALFAGSTFAACSLFNASLSNFIAQEKAAALRGTDPDSPPIVGNAVQIDMAAAVTTGGRFISSGGIPTLVAFDDPSSTNVEVKYPLSLVDTTVSPDTIAVSDTVRLSPESFSNFIEDIAVQYDADTRTVCLSLEIDRDIVSSIGMGAPGEDVSVTVAFKDTSTDKEIPGSEVTLTWRITLQVPIATTAVYYWRQEDGFPQKYAIGFSLPAAEFLATDYIQIQLAHNGTVLANVDNLNSLNTVQWKRAVGWNNWNDELVGIDGAVALTEGTCFYYLTDIECTENAPSFTVRVQGANASLPDTEENVTSSPLTRAATVTGSLKESTLVTQATTTITELDTLSLSTTQSSGTVWYQEKIDNTWGAPVQYTSEIYFTPGTIHIRAWSASPGLLDSEVTTWTFIVLEDNPYSVTTVSVHTNNTGNNTTLNWKDIAEDDIDHVNITTDGFMEDDITFKVIVNKAVEKSVVLHYQLYTQNAEGDFVALSGGTGTAQIRTGVAEVEFKIPTAIFMSSTPIKTSYSIWGGDMFTVYGAAFTLWLESDGYAATAVSKKYYHAYGVQNGSG